MDAIPLNQMQDRQVNIQGITGMDQQYIHQSAEMGIWAHEILIQSYGLPDIDERSISTGHIGRS